MMHNIIYIDINLNDIYRKIKMMIFILKISGEIWILRNSEKNLKRLILTGYISILRRGHLRLFRSRTA